MQNDKSYFTHGNFESNPPSTVNTAKFDCLDLSGPPCNTKKRLAMSLTSKKIQSFKKLCKQFQYFDNHHIKTEFMPKHFQHGPVCKAWLYLILIQSATSPKMYIFLFFIPVVQSKTCLMQERQKRKYSSAVEPGLST